MERSRTGERQPKEICVCELVIKNVITLGLFHTTTKLADRLLDECVGRW